MAREALPHGKMIWIWSEAKDFRSDEDLISITIDALTRPLVSYSGVESFVGQLLQCVDYDDVDTGALRTAFDQLLSQWKTADFTAESIIYGVIRRISRESMNTVVLVDKLCAEILSVLEGTSHAGPSLLRILNVQWLDRPSIKVFAHLCQLASPGVFRQEWIFSRRPPESMGAESDPDSMILRARASIFGRLTELFDPVVVNSSIPQLSIEDLPTLPERANDWFGMTATALIAANYEEALWYCAEALRKEKKVEKAELYRMLGLIYSNLHFIDESYRAFVQAASYCPSGPKRAHLEYLMGLLATKRLYNPELALEHYQRGLTFVNEGSVDGRLEKAWLMNGISFLNVTQLVNRRNQADFGTGIEAVVRSELEALALINRDRTPGATYLRFNLYSNIAFLFEIKGDYETSKRFLKNSLGRYLPAINELQAPQHLYRVGMLEWKAGNTARALEYLAQAVASAEREGNRVYLEHIFYAMGHIAEMAEDLASARKFFTDALDICVQLKDNYMFSTIQKRLSKSTDSSSRAMIPKTKLPGYYPPLDLEAQPKVDMNRYLIETTPNNA